MPKLLDWRELYEVDPVAFAAACIEDERKTVPGPRMLNRWPDGWCVAVEGGVTSIYDPVDERWENSVTDADYYGIWKVNLLAAHASATGLAGAFTGGT
jgi:hypothetical protein